MPRPTARARPPHAGPPTSGTRMKCINVSNFDMTYPDIILPVLNTTYTIRDIISNQDTTVGGDGYRFQEILNTVRPYLSGSNQVRAECAFKAARFQKVK